MSKAFEKLRQRVLMEVEKERAAAGHRQADATELLLGTYLQAALANLNLTRASFASQLKVELDYADALLDGDLPASEIHDEMLQNIARVIDYEPNVLRLMLGRSPLPANVPTSADASDRNDTRHTV